MIPSGSRTVATAWSVGERRAAHVGGAEGDEARRDGLERDEEREHDRAGGRRRRGRTDGHRFGQGDELDLTHVGIVGAPEDVARSRVDTTPRSVGQSPSNSRSTSTVHPTPSR